MKKHQFNAVIHRPAKPGDDASWGFLLIPDDVSQTLPRRGRTTVEGTINGHPFEITLDPDGRLGHWMKVGAELQKAADVRIGDSVVLEIAPVASEPAPALPPDFAQALAAASSARKNWEDTTPIARLDWIHWITSAKQADTRRKRIGNACEMLASGKKRVCCFDPSGFYSKAFRAPDAAV